MIMYKEKKNCICCDSTDLSLLLDLNEQPLANSYHDNTTKLQEYPLGVNLCNNCFHVQLTHIVNPDLLFKDYLYVSGTSKTLKDNFEWFADFVLEYTSRCDSVLDIACIDGSQLDCFKSRGVSETYGIDPAENLYEMSSASHNVICDYFNKEIFSRTFDVIIAQNVFAHNEDALKFLNDCSSIMHDNSLLFIQTSQAEMIQNNQFDTIYHEHISFFNINSMNELGKRSSLNLIDIIKTPVHGISYLFVFSKKELNKYLVQNLINVEAQHGLLSKKLYFEYQTNVNSIVEDFKKVIAQYRANGYTVIGYGAAAKGMTFLNFAQTSLDVIIDDNPLKQNLYTPGTNTIIKSAEYIKTYSEDEKLLFVPLAWNFYDEIRTRISKQRQNVNDRFLKYFPDVKIEE